MSPNTVVPTNGMALDLYLYSMLAVIVLLSFLISFRLLVTRKKIGYLSMVLALVTTLAGYGFMIFYAAYPADFSQSSFEVLLLKLVSFYLANIGIYQLYNATRKRDMILIAFVGLLLGLVAVSYWFMPAWLAGTDMQLKLVQALGMELFMFLLIFLSFMLVNPRIGQNGKYQVMLTVVFIVQTLHMTNVYLFGSGQTMLHTIEIGCLFLFHLVLFLFIFERIIEIMQAIYHSSITDALTGLYNRKFFYNRTRQAIEQLDSAAVIFSDIDNFKKLNDTKGHEAGDRMLKQVAQIMMEEAEEIGLCGRYGGEEMVVLVTDSDTDVQQLAERIRARAEAETGVTVSLGVSVHRQGESADELIKRADEAMYQAKTTGKNKVVTA